MEVVIKILQGYIIFTIILLVIYTIRHFKYSYNRLFYKQRVSYRDIYDSDLPKITVVIPNYTKENLVNNVIIDLLDCDYDRDKLEIIPVNDSVDESITEVLKDYHELYPFVKPVQHLEEGPTVDLNDALKIATGEIIIVFDESYKPSKNYFKKIASAFKDPKVAVVMGRIIPFNSNKNMLTSLFNLERCAGNQMEQQARYSMKLLPQYIGGACGFRKSYVLSAGGFNSKVLSEDTEMAYRLYSKGWSVVYDNSAECYEEAPETWKTRGEQIRRLSRVNNEISFKYFFKFLFSKKISLKGKIDGAFMLSANAVPFLLSIAHIMCVVLFFMGEINILSAWLILLSLSLYDTLGNFAPFFEVGIAAFIDGIEEEINVLPHLCVSYTLYMWNMSLGYIDAVVDRITNRNAKKAKEFDVSEVELDDKEVNDFSETEEMFVEEVAGKDIDEDEIVIEEIDND